MSAPFLATITLLGGGGGAQPKSGGTHLAMITPLSPSGAHPGHDLPGWSGPVDPGYGGGIPPTDPGYGHPGIPGRPPFDPARPDNSLPPGGNPVPPEINNGLPSPGGGYANQVIIAVYVPGTGWTAKAYPEYPSHALPPTGEPKLAG